MTKNIITLFLAPIVLIAGCIFAYALLTTKSPDTSSADDEATAAPSWHCVAWVKQGTTTAVEFVSDISENDAFNKLCVVPSRQKEIGPCYGKYRDGGKWTEYREMENSTVQLHDRGFLGKVWKVFDANNLDMVYDDEAARLDLYNDHSTRPFMRVNCALKPLPANDQPAP